MKVLSFFFLAAIVVSLSHAAQSNEAIDFPGFLEESSAAFEHRQSRLVDIETFNRMAQDGALILDTRSHAAYGLRHIRGAVHLNFSDITSGSLERVVGDHDRVVLIYCNNNFLNDPQAFALKIATAALNIPTFVTLYSYGYRNVYELGSRLDISDPRLALDGQPLPES